MQDLQAIDEAIASLQRRINTALNLIEHNHSSANNRYQAMVKLRQAHEALIKARGRMQTILRGTAKPSSTSLAASPSRPKKSFCDRCGKLLRRKHLSNHMWHVHQIDIDGRTKGLARVAVELQKRDHDLYRDD